MLSSRDVISAAAPESTSSKVRRMDESSASAIIWPARATSSPATLVMDATSPRKVSMYSDSSMTS